MLSRLLWYSSVLQELSTLIAKMGSTIIVCCHFPRQNTIFFFSWHIFLWVVWVGRWWKAGWMRVSQRYCRKDSIVCGFLFILLPVITSLLLIINISFPEILILFLRAGVLNLGKERMIYEWLSRGSNLSTWKWSGVIHVCTYRKRRGHIIGLSVISITEWNKTK